jgi:iron uptake system EfeUOB component EfeO/EfeM
MTGHTDLFGLSSLEWDQFKEKVKSKSNLSKANLSKASLSTFTKANPKCTQSNRSQPYMKSKSTKASSKKQSENRKSNHSMTTAIFKKHNPTNHSVFQQSIKH